MKREIQGGSNGFSVQQVIDVCLKVTGKEIIVIEGERREGDPAVLVADSSQANGAWLETAVWRSGIHCKACVGVGEESLLNIKAGKT